MKLGIDTGGTFTDFILQTNEGFETFKVSSTPDDPSNAILKGLHHFFPVSEEDSSLQLPSNLEIIHGTTVGTNAFIQRKGAKTLLVTTKGFEDVLYIGRQNRKSLYDINIERSPEIIARDFVIGIKERIAAGGDVQVPLADDAGQKLYRYCLDNDIETVAICLLHSYLNSDHENTLALALKNIKGLSVTVSSHLLPEFREFERLTTTLINAYLAPVISKYIDRLSRKLAPNILYIQQSNGGVLPADGISERAVHTVLSGPAGGVHGAFSMAQVIGIDQIITFDMGGTSTDVSLCDKVPTLTRDYSIDSYPIRTQVIDIHTVGAGGGSIAHIDSGGLLHVGPESAGAYPGPVCYGKGDRLTVTDANLFLGRLLPDKFLGGTMTLQFSRVKEKMVALAKELNLSPVEAAQGIIRIVNVGMVKAIRAVSLEKGYDPKEFVLFSFGGASGLHCCDLATELGIYKIIVPARAGILSAQGMVMSEPTLDGSKALFLTGEDISHHNLQPAFLSLEKGLKEQMKSLCKTGTMHVERFLDLRYQGQSYEISIKYDDDFEKVFHKTHTHHFGYKLSDVPLELVSIRCTIRMETPSFELPAEKGKKTKLPIQEEMAPVLFENGKVVVPVYQRKLLKPGHTLKGPALVVDNYTTILVQENYELSVDSLLNIILIPFK